MKTHKILSIIGLATLGLSFTPSFASAATITRLSNFTDQQFRDLLNSGDFTELFVAEGRMGNNQLNGDWELGIWDARTNPFTIVDQDNFVWASGKTEDFTLEYTGSTVNYTVGGVLLSSNAFGSSVNDIYIRTRETETSNIRIDSLFFEGEDLGTGAISEPGDLDSDRVDYLRISDISKPFTLTGKVTMSWTGTQPRGSNLAYQIKVGPTNNRDVPEPGTVGALLLTGIAAMGCRKTKRTVDD
ncbi:MAG TPA: PEP-CTERM sorting domain-containing protein [Cyanobacteria bacterium UBA12227]|nr:PEP-CTERM sorting domain-containing protein [Cyanobacteria bacterium UBA12227]HAX89443.1 PEP-CTERM sorting domain-containing protein [Cyanobacteria bacterium UBA11370]